MAKIKVLRQNINTSRLEERLKKLKQYSEGFGDYFKAMSEHVGFTLQAEVINNLQSHTRSGRLIKSIRVKTTPKGVQVYSDPTFFEEGQYYAPWVEEGTSTYIYPKTSGALSFYSWGQHYIRKKVRGQEGIHYMKSAVSNPNLKKDVEELAVHYANLALGESITDYALSYRNKAGNRRGHNLTKWYTERRGNKTKLKR